MRRIVGAVRTMAWTERVKGEEPELLLLGQASPSGLGLSQVVLTMLELVPPQELVPGRSRAILKPSPAEVRVVCSL